MQIGRKIYFDIFTGEVLAEISERQGFVRETAQEEDFAIYEGLKGKLTKDIGIIQHSYGELSDSFKRGYGYTVNPITKIIIFNFTPPPIKPTKDEIITDLTGKLSVVISALNVYRVSGGLLPVKESEVI